MNPYALIDLHCDTLTDCIHKGLTPDTLDAVPIPICMLHGRQERRPLF